MTTAPPPSEKWPDQARVVAIMAVTVIHVSAAAVTKTDPGSFDWWVGILYNSGTRWCVPVFAMISGYLLLDPSKQESLRVFYQKRASRILYPLLFWTVFYLAYSLSRSVIRHEPIDPAKIVTSVIAGSPYFHLWFLYMIVGLYLFTPFVRMMLSRATMAETAFLCAAGFVIVAIATGLDFFNHATPGGFFLTGFIPYLPYFIAGHVLGRASIPISLGAALAIAAAAIALTMLGSHLLWPTGFGQYPGTYHSVTVIPMSIAIFVAVRLGGGGKSPLWARIAPLTFGIYLIHLFFFSTLGLAGVNIKLFTPVLSIPAFAAAIFVLSLASAWVMSKIPGLRRAI